MGTRNLICVVVDKKMKVAQYSQWDGYLAGQGKIVIDFIANKMKLEAFKKAVRECKWINAAQVRKTYVEAGDKPNNKSGMISMDIADKHSAMYPGLSRDTGGQILRLIQDGKFSKTVRGKKGFVEKTFTTAPVRELVDNKSFAADSLFCEWAYVIDLDKKVLEIYQGLNTGKSKGRWSKVPAVKGEKYRAISLWQTVTFDECKKNALANLTEIDKRETDERVAKETAEAEAKKEAEALILNAQSAVKMARK